MKGSSISANKLSKNALDWLRQLEQTLVIREHGHGTIRNYVQEMTLLFKFYHDKEVEQITQKDIEDYIIYIKKAHKVGRAKCRSVAQACSYFFKRVMPQFEVCRFRGSFTCHTVVCHFFVIQKSSFSHPKKQFVLPNIMTEEQVAQMINADLTLREYCVVSLLYGCGMRISEVCNLRIKDIESSNSRIKIYQGKGAKDRYTLLPNLLLEKLRLFYISVGRPQKYLFTNHVTKTAMHVRSMQLVVNSAMTKAGFQECGFTAHTLRHSFATHMLDQGNNIHIIKTLLGPSKLETTMIYLHLQKHTQLGIKSPLENIHNGSKSE